MAEEQQTTMPQEICSMSIMFPVTSDEQAIEYKKKINDVLSDIPQARIEFSLTSIPVRLPNVPQIR